MEAAKLGNLKAMEYCNIDLAMNDIVLSVYKNEAPND